MDLLRSIRAFVAVAGASSFTAAARELGIGTPGVSRAISELEAHLGLRLLQRTTRSVELTAAGDRYLAHCTSILDRLGQAEVEAAGLCARPVGVLHIGVDPTFDPYHLAWLIFGYQERYPDVTIETSYLSRSLDVVSAIYDVVLISGSIPRSERMVFHRIGAASTVLCASPNYLRSNGVPKSISELRHHRCLQVKYMDVAYEQWVFEGPDGPEVFRCDEARVLIHTFEALSKLIQDGAGIGELPVSKALPAIRSGLLVRVLPEFDLTGRDLHVLCSTAHYGQAKVNAWCEFVQIALPGRLSEDQVSLISYPSGISDASKALEIAIAGADRP